MTAPFSDALGDCPNFSKSTRKMGLSRFTDDKPILMNSPTAITSVPSGSSTHERPHIGYKSVTVIVPVRNEENAIARTIQQLLEQQREGLKLEILVVDGRSTDKTRDIVAQYAAQHPEIRLLDNPKRLSSAARNIAIRESDSNYVVIIDGHCELPTRSYFYDLVDAFERSGADCLGRPQPLDVSKATTLQQAIAAARSSPLGHHPDSFIYTNEEVDCPAGSVAVAYKRSVFKSVGLFDEQFDACEDYELNHRIDKAGLRCRLIPKLTVKYEPRKTLSGLFQQLYRYGRGACEWRVGTEGL